ncbi:uncharacterized protein BCR38DRAFT_124063 [Pseudomassariella vexata]|uniref:Uncharacterized protein n=1 Tax=Pseudomassariella vexata TaxID=1141098 RepID=A0A1Y2D850_9PEZI|nr:uncharacterized protein BCR38DRAFT_124063 [Pseudomassariella vexata]ORY55440.1 hypothetical protein BCR38DRAFT_124063 [Pseudomassariella vexata]
MWDSKHATTSRLSMPGNSCSLGSGLSYKAKKLRIRALGAIVSLRLCHGYERALGRQKGRTKSGKADLEIDEELAGGAGKRRSRHRPIDRKRPSRNALCAGERLQAAMETADVVVGLSQRTSAVDNISSSLHLFTAAQTNRTGLMRQWEKFSHKG